MKKSRPYLHSVLLLLVLLLAACNAGSDDEPGADDDVGPGMGPGMMDEEMDGPGMGGPMMGGPMMGEGPEMRARHQAPIPAEYEGMTSPVQATQESLARGEEVYTTYCQTCHGPQGMGDGPGGESLDPAPAPVAHTSQMLGDAYLFWRISEGGAMEPFNSAMPAWKDTLDEQQRWDVINYIRSLQ